MFTRVMPRLVHSLRLAEAVMGSGSGVLGATSTEESRPKRN